MHCGCTNYFLQTVYVTESQRKLSNSHLSSEHILGSYMIDRSVAAGGRGTRVSACAGLTDQLLSCCVDSRIAWKDY